MLFNYKFQPQNLVYTGILIILYIICGIKEYYTCYNQTEIMIEIAILILFALITIRLFLFKKINKYKDY